MTREEIAQKLRENHERFIEYITGLDEDDFMYSYNNKWTAGQQMDHIYRSVKPLIRAYSVPGFMLRFKFGKANRPSRDYESLVVRYHERLVRGGKAPETFSPAPIAYEMRQELGEQLRITVDKLYGLVNRYPEKKLDRLILPHPLMGKLTLREMLYFTVHHAEHHLNKTRANLKHKTDGPMQEETS